MFCANKIFTNYGKFLIVINIFVIIIIIPSRMIAKSLYI